jgi:hypothetical protein
MYRSGNIPVQNCVHAFESPCIITQWYELPVLITWDIRHEEDDTVKFCKIPGIVIQTFEPTLISWHTRIRVSNHQDPVVMNYTQYEPMREHHAPRNMGLRRPKTRTPVMYGLLFPPICLWIDNSRDKTWRMMTTFIPRRREMLRPATSETCYLEMNISINYLQGSRHG